MRRPLALLVGAVFLAAAPAAPVPEAARMPVLYFPTEVGAKWVSTDDADGSHRAVTKVEAKDGAAVVHVGRVAANGQTTPEEVVVVSRKGLSWVVGGGQPIEPPLTMLALPVVAGAEWQTEYTHAGSTNTASYQVAGSEVVEVPAGRFTAVRVEAKYRLGAGDISQTSWFAPRVGQVKFAAEGKTVRELVKFTPGKGDGR